MLTHLASVRLGMAWYLLLACQSLIVEGQEASGPSDDVVVTLLERYCYDCHGAETQEAGIRLDTFDLSAADGHVIKFLPRMLDALNENRMPPENADRPSNQERTIAIARMRNRLSDALRSSRAFRNRRLTVAEYNHTMQALFGVDAQFGEMIPDDPISESGYRNDASRLGLSSLQMEAYLDSARRAIERYVPVGPHSQPPLSYHIELEDLYYSTADRYGSRKRAPAPIDSAHLARRRTSTAETAPTFVAPLSPKLPGAYSDDEKLRAAIPKLNQQYVAFPKRLPVGELIVRVRAAATSDRDGRFPRMRVEAGVALGDGCSLNKRLLGEVDVHATKDEPGLYEFRARLEDIPTKGPLSDETSFDQLSVFDMDQIYISNVTADPKAIFDLGKGGYRESENGSERIAGDLKKMSEAGVCFLHLDSLEIEMLPGVGADNRPYRWQIPSAPASQEHEVAKTFLSSFMTAAYRRDVGDQEVEAKLMLFESLRERGFDFQKSLQESLAAVLVSPSFLFLESNPLGEHAAADRVAARLSYFLTLSPPDDRLLECARNKSILDRDVFRAEAERLLKDPRRRRFLISFCRQWLRLDRHAHVAVSREIYPTYDEDLAVNAVSETLATFVEIFESDSNALDLLDSDFAMLNDRLARHYDLSLVETGDLHRVNLPPDSVRGGLLAHASLLTMNSDGAHSHPIRRGVWILDRLLNTPPPPPPANVPEIDAEDPDFRGLSLKEQIELHRQPGSCKNCHQRIDPWGIALERFDATGRWRDNFDATTQLPGGHRISGIAELKAHLRRHHAEEFTDALVHHLLTYALGRAPDYLDRSQVQLITQRFADSDFRLRELVLAIVESELFQN